MPTFRYKMLKGGEVVEDVADAPDRFSLYRAVRKDGGAVIDLEELRPASPLVSLFQELLERVSTAEKIIFARNLGAMLEAGLTLSRALSVLERQSKNRAFRKIMVALRESIARGESLHAALARFPDVFPAVFSGMVKAGEESGGLSRALRAAGDQLDRMYALSKRVRGALLYPAIVIVAMIVVGALMLVFVVPTLSATFKEFGAELPASTAFVIALSDFLVGNFALSLSLFLFLLAAPFLAARTRRGKRALDALILKIPVVGPLVREANAARTTRTLSSLLSAGVEVIAALSITKDVIGNVHYKDVLSLAGERIEKGSSFAETFARREDLFPVLVSEMIAVGEETGKLPGMLEAVADFYDADIEQQTKNLSSVIEPALMVVVGSAVGFFALSMISPIYSLSQGI